MTGRSSGLLTLIALLLPCTVFTAPLIEQSTETESYYPVADATGCYYNFHHYDEGDRIITNELCLNCTCHNRMLMCYLRVCPFIKAIGENCKVEKRSDQCCPVIICPEVPVKLLTSTTETSASSEVGHLDKYGCSIDKLFYSDGARVPSDPNKPCELCYCIRNKTACVMQECTLHIEGCKPVYQEGVCCPVKYDCDHPEETLPETTTSPVPTTGLIFTTTLLPGIPSDCIHNGEIYADGALIRKETACEHCYCMKGDIVCAVQECGPTPLDKVNCTALPPAEGKCCPDTYDCEYVSEQELTTTYYELTTQSAIKHEEENFTTEYATSEPLLTKGQEYEKDTETTIKELPQKPEAQTEYEKTYVTLPEETATPEISSEQEYVPTIEQTTRKEETISTEKNITSEDAETGKPVVIPSEEVTEGAITQEIEPITKITTISEIIPVTKITPISETIPEKSTESQPEDQKRIIEATFTSPEKSEQTTLKELPEEFNPTTESAQVEIATTKVQEKIPEEHVTESLPEEFSPTTETTQVEVTTAKVKEGIPEEHVTEILPEEFSPTTETAQVEVTTAKVKEEIPEEHVTESLPEEFSPTTETAQVEITTTKVKEEIPEEHVTESLPEEVSPTTETAQVEKVTAKVKEEIPEEHITESLPEEVSPTTETAQVEKITAKVKEELPEEHVTETLPEEFSPTTETAQVEITSEKVKEEIPEEHVAESLPKHTAIPEATEVIPTVKETLSTESESQTEILYHKPIESANQETIPEKAEEQTTRPEMSIPETTDIKDLATKIPPEEVITESKETETTSIYTILPKVKPTEKTEHAVTETEKPSTDEITESELTTSLLEDGIHHIPGEDIEYQDELETDEETQTELIHEPEVHEESKTEVPEQPEIHTEKEMLEESHKEIATTQKILVTEEPEFVETPKPVTPETGDIQTDRQKVEVEPVEEVQPTTEFQPVTEIDISATTVIAETSKDTELQTTPVETEAAQVTVQEAEIVTEELPAQITAQKAKTEKPTEHEIPTQTERVYESTLEPFTEVSEIVKSETGTPSSPEIKTEEILKEITTIRHEQETEISKKQEPEEFKPSTESIPIDTKEKPLEIVTPKPDDLFETNEVVTQHTEIQPTQPTKLSTEFKESESTEKTTEHIEIVTEVSDHTVKAMIALDHVTETEPRIPAKPGIEQETISPEGLPPPCSNDSDCKYPSAVQTSKPPCDEDVGCVPSIHEVDETIPETQESCVGANCVQETPVHEIHEVQPQPEPCGDNVDCAHKEQVPVDEIHEVPQTVIPCESGANCNVPQQITPVTPPCVNGNVNDDCRSIQENEILHDCVNGECKSSPPYEEMPTISTESIEKLEPPKSEEPLTTNIISEQTTQKEILPEITEYTTDRKPIKPEEPTDTEHTEKDKINEETETEHAPIIPKPVSEVAITEKEGEEEKSTLPSEYSTESAETVQEVEHATEVETKPSTQHEVEETFENTSDQTETALHHVTEQLYPAGTVATAAETVTEQMKEIVEQSSTTMQQEKVEVAEETESPELPETKLTTLLPEKVPETFTSKEAEEELLTTVKYLPEELVTEFGKPIETTELPAKEAEHSEDTTEVPLRNVTEEEISENKPIETTEPVYHEPEVVRTTELPEKTEHVEHLPEQQTESTTLKSPIKDEEHVPTTETTAIPELLVKEVYTKGPIEATTKEIQEITESTVIEATELEKETKSKITEAPESGITEISTSKAQLLPEVSTSEITTETEVKPTYDKEERPLNESIILIPEKINEICKDELGCKEIPDETEPQGEVTPSYTEETGQPECLDHECKYPVENIIPGEGSCLIDGQTYENNSSVPPINRCQVSCKCISSILICDSVTCLPAPSNLENCMPIYHSLDSCCPTYSCTSPGTSTIKSDSHKIEEKTTISSIPSTEEQTIKSDSHKVEEEATEPSVPSVEEQSTVTVIEEQTEQAEEDITKQEQPKEEIPIIIESQPSEAPSITESTIAKEKQTESEKEAGELLTTISPPKKISEEPAKEEILPTEKTEAEKAEIPTTLQTIETGTEAATEEIKLQPFTSKIPEAPSSTEELETKTEINVQEQTTVKAAELVTESLTTFETEDILHKDHTSEESALPITTETITEKTSYETVAHTTLESIEIDTETEIKASEAPSATEGISKIEEPIIQKATSPKATETAYTPSESATEGVTISEIGEVTETATHIEEITEAVTIAELPSVTEKKYDLEITEQEGGQFETTPIISVESETEKRPQLVTEEPVKQITEHEVSEPSKPEQEEVVAISVQPEQTTEIHEPQITDKILEPSVTDVKEHDISTEYPKHVEGEIIVPGEETVKEKVTESVERETTEVSELETELPSVTTAVYTEYVSEDIKVPEVSYATEKVYHETTVSETQDITIPEKQATESPILFKTGTQALHTTVESESEQTEYPLTYATEESKIPEKSHEFEATTELFKQPELDTEKSVETEGVTGQEITTESIYKPSDETESATEKEIERTGTEPQTLEAETTKTPSAISSTEEEHEITPPGQETASVTEYVTESVTDGVKIADTEKPEQAVTEHEKLSQTESIFETETETVTVKGSDIKTETTSAKHTAETAYPDIRQPQEHVTEAATEVYDVTDIAGETVKIVTDGVTDVEKEGTTETVSKETAHISEEPSVTEEITVAHDQNVTEVVEEHKVPEKVSVTPTQEIFKPAEVTEAITQLPEYSPSPKITTEIPTPELVERVTVGPELKLNTSESYLPPLYTAETTPKSVIMEELSTSGVVPSDLQPLLTTFAPDFHVTSTTFAPDYHTKHPTKRPLAPEPEEEYHHPPAEEDYDEEEQGAFGPGTCRYSGKVYVSAQQIPRDDPCDFCFCFRSDIICLQQSCPPPIPKCHEEPIRGFCCPRYECPVSMATSVNVSTTTTTTTTTLPPHFLHHAYKGRATKAGCQIQGQSYRVGEIIKKASGPCLHCVCGGDGQMQCDPKVCSPEPMLRQMIEAAVSRR